jgi:RNA polymerase II subunit A C-terminal domain phosphatase
MWAVSFGAHVSPNLTKSTTHVIADKDRRTSKVRQAAKHPHIKIVDRLWLFECFSRWTRVDEDQYIIPVEEDNRPIIALPTADRPEVILHLSDDEERGGMGDEDENELPESPIEEMLEDFNWDDFDDEINEMLESEGTQDSDLELDDAPPPLLSEAEASRKRKLGDLDEDAANGAGESRLQLRKKRAFGRTTSLTHVASAAEESGGLPSPETTAVEEGEGDDDEAGREMEREMLAAFEADDVYEEKGDG